MDTAAPTIAQGEGCLRAGGYGGLGTDCHFPCPFLRPPFVSLSLAEWGEGDKEAPL